MPNKELVKNVLFRVGDAISFCPFFYRFVQRTVDKKIWVPYYHIIGNKPEPHIRHLYKYKTIQQFRDDLIFFKNEFNVIELDQLIDHFEYGNQLPDNALLITFDDGMKEIYEYVVPILKEMELSAAFFLCSDFIDNANMFYKHKASLIVDTLMNEASNDQIALIADKHFQGNHNLKYIRRNLLKIDYLQKDILDSIARDLGLSFSDYLYNKKPYLTSDQIEQILNAGFYIGAHSIDHPNYSKIDFDQQISQTTKSVTAIVNQFSLSYRAFSMPFHDTEVSRKYFDTIINQGIVDISFGIDGTFEDVISRNLQRLNMEGNIFPVKSMILTYSIVILLRKLFGRAKIER